MHGRLHNARPSAKCRAVCTTQVRLFNAGPSAQCRAVCAMQGRPSAQRRAVCATQGRLRNAGPSAQRRAVCTMQCRLNNAGHSAQCRAVKAVWLKQLFSNGVLFSRFVEGCLASSFGPRSAVAQCHAGDGLFSQLLEFGTMSFVGHVRSPCSGRGVSRGTLRTSGMVSGRKFRSRGPHLFARGGIVTVRFVTIPTKSRQRHEHGSRS